MIANRFLQQLKQQHWTGVFIELVIVIVGVFIGLQVSNWNQARQDRALEGQYLKRLHDDIGLSIKIAQSNLRRMEKQYQLEGGMLASLASCHLDAASKRNFSAGIFLLGRIEPPPLVRGTVDELRSTGRLRLIHDVALRTGLGRVVEVNNIETRVLNMIMERATPAISYIDMRVVLNQPPGGFVAPDIQQHGMPEGGVTYDFTALCKDPHIAPAISAVQELTHVMIQGNKGRLTSFQALQKIIDRDLAGMKMGPATRSHPKATDLHGGKP